MAPNGKNEDIHDRSSNVMGWSKGVWALSPNLSSTGEDHVRTVPATNAMMLAENKKNIFL